MVTAVAIVPPIAVAALVAAGVVWYVTKRARRQAASPELPRSENCSNGKSDQDVAMKLAGVTEASSAVADEASSYGVDLSLDPEILAVLGSIGEEAFITTETAQQVRQGQHGICT